MDGHFDMCNSISISISRCVIILCTSFNESIKMVTNSNAQVFTKKKFEFFVAFAFAIKIS